MCEIVGYACEAYKCADGRQVRTAAWVCGSSSYIASAGCC